MLISKECAYSQGALVLEVLVQEGQSALNCSRRMLAIVSERHITTSGYGGGKGEEGIQGGESERAKKC